MKINSGNITIYDDGYEFAKDFDTKIAYGEEWVNTQYYRELKQNGFLVIFKIGHGWCSNPKKRCVAGNNKKCKDCVKLQNKLFRYKKLERIMK